MAMMILSKLYSWESMTPEHIRDITIEVRQWSCAKTLPGRGGARRRAVLEK